MAENCSYPTTINISCGSPNVKTLCVELLVGLSTPGVGGKTWEVKSMSNGDTGDSCISTKSSSVQ